MYSLFRDLAIIILSAKFFGLVARKCKAPQVVGEIIAGLLIGPCLLNLVQISDSISIFVRDRRCDAHVHHRPRHQPEELIKAGPIATLDRLPLAWLCLWWAAPYYMVRSTALPQLAARSSTGRCSSAPL